MRDHHASVLSEDGQDNGKSLHTNVSKKVGLPLLVTSVNTVKIVVGSGILSLAWSYYYSTLLPAAFFTILFGMLAAMNFYFLGICSSKTGLASYGSVWSRCFGQRAGLVIDLTFIPFLFSICQASLVFLTAFTR